MNYDPLFLSGFSNEDVILKSIICEICGSNDILKTDGFFVCQHCGTKYTVEEARKIMIEGTVVIDRTPETQNLLKLARRYRVDGMLEKALGCYDQVLQVDSSNWEAYFFSTYYQSFLTSPDNAGLVASKVLNCLREVFTLLKNGENDSNDHRKSVYDLTTYLSSIASQLFEICKNQSGVVISSLRNSRGAIPGVSILVEDLFFKKHLQILFREGIKYE